MHVFLPHYAPLFSHKYHWFSFSDIFGIHPRIHHPSWYYREKCSKPYPDVWCVLDVADPGPCKYYHQRPPKTITRTYDTNDAWRRAHLSVNLNLLTNISHWNDLAHDFTNVHQETIIACTVKDLHHPCSFCTVSWHWRRPLSSWIISYPAKKLLICGNTES